MSEEDKINIKNILKQESKIMNINSLLSFEILYTLQNIRKILNFPKNQLIIFYSYLS